MAKTMKVPLNHDIQPIAIRICGLTSRWVARGLMPGVGPLLGVQCF